MLSLKTTSPKIPTPIQRHPMNGSEVSMRPNNSVQENEKLQSMNPNYNETLAIINLIIATYPVTEFGTIWVKNGTATVIAFIKDTPIKFSMEIDYEDLDSDCTIKNLTFTIE